MLTPLTRMLCLPLSRRRRSADTEWLASHNLIDYSLRVAVHRVGFAANGAPLVATADAAAEQRE